MSFLSRLKSRKFLLVIFDLLCFCVIDAIYMLLMFLFKEFSQDMLRNLISSSVTLLICVFTFRGILGFYTNVIWRYIQTKVLLRVIISDACATLTSVLISSIAFGYTSSVWFLMSVAAFFALATLSSRFVYRLMYKKSNTVNTVDSEHDNRINVAIVGAGQIGTLLCEELMYNTNSHYKPICFIDSDIRKKGRQINGLKVLHEDENIITKIKELSVQEILIAITGLDNDTAQKLFDFYSQTGCKIKIYDSPVREMGVSDDSSKRAIREFQIEDLLFRKPIAINNTEVLNFYSGKTVLITGGGGSIGSELCRQIAKCSPKKLVIIDIYENNAYDIQQELLRTYPKLDLSVEIASVRDRDRLDSLFAMYKPDIVFHAAAHKHVPLMERSGCEAIKNNVMGTYNTADMAEKYGVSKFILISTDKAVNPTNIMGASKRLCEMVIQCRTDSKTCFAAVRFGNVLGSNGSVIPLFKRQIQNGGPITITDKRIIRYFMTIPEASQLVIQAGSMAKSGELFVLDMGRPVKIYDLAVNMIRLSGLKPDEDIKIEEIGLRPGEKLFEELLMKSETLTKTNNNMIFIEKDTPCSREEVEQKLAVLRAAVAGSGHQSGSELIKDAIRKTVPTFRDPEEINKTAEQSSEMKNVL